MENPSAPPAPVPSPVEDAALRRELRALWKALRAPPYYRVVSAASGWVHGLGVERTVTSLAAAGMDAPTQVAISFTRVHVADAASHDPGATYYSRTHLPLPPHTDSSSLAEPHELLAFHMVRPDASGGDSTVLPVDRLLGVLPAKLIASLRVPVPFGPADRPILWGEAPAMRYYRAQIDHAFGSRPMPAEVRDRLDALDSMLEQQGLCDRLRLEAGDVIFINNRHALHGRTGFAAESERLLLRYRAHAPALRL